MGAFSWIFNMKEYKKALASVKKSIDISGSNYDARYNYTSTLALPLNRNSLILIDFFVASKI
jgi:hypothetical protein